MPPLALPQAVTDNGVQERVLVPPATEPNPKDVVQPGSSRPPQAEPGRAYLGPPLATGGEMRPGDPGPPFSLPAAIDYALKNNPRLRIAWAQADQARGKSEAAYAPFLPTADLYYKYAVYSEEAQPTSLHLPSVVGFGPGTQAFGQGELQLQYLLCDFGRRNNRLGQAVSREQLASMRYQRAKETVAYDVTAAYLHVLWANAARLVQEQAVKRAESILKDTEARRKGGVADRDDVLRAEVQLSESRENLTSTRQAELDALSRLNLAMGRNPGLPLQVEQVDRQPLFGLSLAECLELAAAQRPEVGIARAGIAASEYGLKAARAEFAPRVITKGLVARLDGSGIESGFVEAGAIVLEQKLFDGFKRLADTHVARAEVEEAVAQAQAILDSISLDVNLAYHQIAATRERIRYSETSVVQARENLRLVRVKYMNGDATPTDIVDAEIALTRSEQRFYSATYEYLTALARLDYAMGRPQGAFLHAPTTGPAGTPGEETLPVPRTLPGVD